MKGRTLLLVSFLASFLLATMGVSIPKEVTAGERAAHAFAWLPMARKGEGITSPKILAERIRDSLKHSPSGNGMVKGANISPQGFLTAVKKAGGEVEGVHALPQYLESLIERDMPSGTLTMSRVKYSRLKYGLEKFELDVEKGYPREAHKGEKGFYDPNTGYLILAGDCSNSPLMPVKGPVATPSTLVPSAPLAAIPQGECVKSLRLNIWETKALNVSGVRAMVEETLKDDPNSFYRPNRVSRSFGATFRALHARGELARSTRDHTVLIVVKKKDEVTHLIFTGVVKNGVQELKLPLDFEDHDVVMVNFTPGSMVSPLKNDLRAKGVEFLHCTTNLHAIEAEAR
jgi:hypothetical protein